MWLIIQEISYTVRWAVWKTSFLGMEVITFAIIVFMMSRLDVEKHIEEDHRIIKENQKKAVLAAGGTWEED